MGWSLEGALGLRSGFSGEWREVSDDRAGSAGGVTPSVQYVPWAQG